MSTRPSARRWERPGAVALLALVLVAYAPALDAGWIWDDDDYVTANATLRSVGGLARIWVEPGAVPQYYPMAFTSLWLDHQIWGVHPFGYHLVNVLLHALNAMLLWRLLVALGVPGAWLGAALFAVHPVHVESVAWVTERKNVLSGAFYLGAFLAYLRAGARAYAFALALFVLAMLAKTVACTLPAALLLVVWWKRGRLERRDVMPLVPFFAVGLGLAAMTIWMEKHHVGAQGADWALSIADRCLVAGRALWFYLGKLVWPSPLVFNYPRWRIDAGAWWQWLFPLAALAAGGVLCAARRRLGAGPLVAALFFAVTLLPALGFVDVFPMRYSFVADHFQYLASIGPLALAAAVAAPRTVSRVAGGVVVLVLAALTWRQTHVYYNLGTLWADTLAKNPSSWMAHNNLGLLLAGEGRLDDAIAHYRAALAIRADDAFARNNLGWALAQQGRLDAALVELREAVRVEPDNAEARSNLGNALMATGQPDAAIVQYREALRVNPRWADAHNNLAGALAARGRHDEALAEYAEAIRADPDYAAAHRNLGVMLAEDGKLADAAEQLATAARLAPGAARTQHELGLVRARQGRLAEATPALAEAVRLEPSNAEAQRDLGAVLAQQGRFAEAVSHLEAAARLAPGDAETGEALAAARARAGSR